LPRPIVFDYAVDLLQNRKYQDAADSFAKFMSDFPDSPLKGRAHFNLALSFKDMGDIARARATFLEILDMPYNERDDNSLMEPYTLYKHHSCRMLAFMALDDHDYGEAERYINMFDKKFPYQHFCGNEWSAYNMFKAVMLARVYFATNRSQKAIETLVPYTFSDALASNQSVLEELDTVVRHEFTTAQIKAEFTHALQSLQLKKRKHGTTATITLFNVDAEVEDYSDPTGSNEALIQRYKEIVTANELFKRYLE
jgi:tetratricopeptide (TPR) repeat protein